ncbi:membrane protein [Gordoniibacillus kamchatkensis]|uniref:Membrane protein n=1 Tax=Gordoniibacillus kamchatkensis TaxID=1590651 RepID=A0ABR5AJY3_9BACL|nr:DUF423 domain-containing protein [Paenibacillus sp. VKM B-2647]KIL41270.1 membrane protein [Paenibacillus sp. VKM B-2647]
MIKTFIALGSLNAFLAVALGAFGAHALKSRLSPDMLDVYHTGVNYHIIHALALLLIAVLADKLGASSLVAASGWALFAGIVLFSGSLYALSLSGVKTLGAITPLGGVAFLAGWLCLAIAALRG